MTQLNVEKFMRFLMSLTHGHAVDDEGYVVEKLTGKRVFLRKKPILVIKDKIQDPEAFVLNPVNEALKTNVTTRWLYAQLTIAMIQRATLIVGEINTIVEDGDQADIPPAFRKAYSRYIKEFDKKTGEHFIKMMTDPMAFMNITYDRAQRTSKLRCALFDDESHILTGVRKKSVKTLTKLMADVLQVTSDDDIENKYTSKSRSLIAPKLESFLTVLANVYDAVNDTLTKMGMGDSEYIVDLTEMGTHIKNLEGYYNKTKWFSGTPDVSAEASITANAASTISPSSAIVGAKPWERNQPIGGGFIKTDTINSSVSPFVNIKRFGQEPFITTGGQSFNARVHHAGFIPVR